MGESCSYRMIRRITFQNKRFIFVNRRHSGASDVGLKAMESGLGSKAHRERFAVHKWAELHGEILYPLGIMSEQPESALQRSTIAGRGHVDQGPQTLLIWSNRAVGHGVPQKIYRANGVATFSLIHS